MKFFMNVLMPTQKYQAKLSLSKVYVIPILLILAVALGCLQYGISVYKDSLEQKAIFQDVEKNKTETYSSYRQYASFGFRVLYVPAPISVFFTNSTVLQDVSAYIDSGERLNIYKPLKGRTVFDISKYLFADFSGILFFFGSLIGLLYGYTAFSNTEYQRFLASITGVVKLFISTLLARSIMLIFFVIFFIVAAILLIALNGVSIDFDQPLLSFFMEICGVSIFFLALGSVFGTFKLQILGFIGAVSSWFSFLFIVPFLVSIIVAAKSDVIKPEYKLEIEKLKLMMDFEKRSDEIAGVLGIKQNPTDIDRELVLSYYNNQFPKIQKLEEEVKIQIQELTNLYYKLSSCFPTTRYLALINEVSSKGYKTLYVFYESVKQIKEAFFKEYMEKVYFSSQPEKIKVEPFLKGDENIFKGKPGLPDYYLQGTLFNLLWIAALAMISYYCFKKSLFEMPLIDKIPSRTSRHIDIKSKAVNSWHVNENYLNTYLYNFLANKTGQINKKAYQFTISLDSQPWNATERQEFLYLCHPKEIPGHIKAGNLLKLTMNLMNVPVIKRNEIATQFSLAPIMNKRFDRLNRDELGNVFLAILEMKPFSFYLIDDIGRKMYWDFCDALMQKMTSLSREATVLFLNEGAAVIGKNEMEKLYFNETDNWSNIIISLKSVYSEPGKDNA